jgi:hypothetical protein
VVDASCWRSQAAECMGPIGCRGKQAWTAYILLLCCIAVRHATQQVSTPCPIRGIVIVQDAHLSMLRKDMSLLDLELLELKLKLKMGEGYSKSPVQVGGHPCYGVAVISLGMLCAAHAGCHVSKRQSVLGCM